MTYEWVVPLILRHLLRQNAAAVFTVTLLMVGAIWFSQSLKLLQAVVDGGAPIWYFFQLMLLIFPGFLVPIIPIALFIGLLFVMHKSIQDQEWIVMQGTGLGPWQLARPCLILALVITCAHWAISIDVAPSALRELRLQRKLIQTDYAGALLREGTFNPVGSNITVYVKNRQGSNKFSGILIHDTRDAKATVTLTAEQGFLVQDDGPPRLVIQQGTRQVRNNATGEMTWLKFDQTLVDISLFSSVRDDSFIKSYERPITELFAPPTDQDSQNSRQEFLAEAHKRISFPLYNIAFALLAMVIVLGGEYSRRGRPHRYALGMLCAIAMQSLALAMGNLATGNNALIPLLYIPPILAAAALGLWLQRLTGQPAVEVPHAH